MENSRFSNGERPNSMMLRRTLFLMIVCGIVAFLALIGRLFYLQIISHDDLEAQAIERQVRDTKLTADRGAIYDTNGKILAMSATVHNVIICPAQIRNDEETEKIAQCLYDVLGIDIEKSLEMASDRASWYKIAARKIEPELTDKIREYKNENKLDGLILEEDTKRYYPYGSLASHVIGFVGMENNGQAGIEDFYNEELTGKDGRVVRSKNGIGQDLIFTNFEEYYDSTDGASAVTTIDLTIQYYLEKHLEQATRDYDTQNGAAAIAMDVNTGEIKGMVSLGNFDLNDYQSLSEEAQRQITLEPDPEKQEQMLRDAQYAQWRNKALSDTYEPGSTFKIITLAMALNDGAVSVDDHFFCGGSLKLPGDAERHCWKTQGHGDQTLQQALQHSCNVAFMNIGLRLGQEKFFEYCEAFGIFNSSTDKDAYLTAETGIDLFGESGSIWWPENLFCDEDNKSQLAAASFGQTFNITPLQLITAVSAVVNGGNLMEPYVVSELVDDDGNIIYKKEPTVVRQVISEKTSEIMCGMIESVVGDSVDGTGKNAYVPGYRIGGKTGTSTNTTIEAVTGKKQYIVSFIGVAPIDDPQLAILVLLDSPSNETGIYISGGQMGAPTVGKMFADILPYMGIEPIYSEEELELMDKTVPDLVGLSSVDGEKELNEAGFGAKIIGDGLVTKQMPNAGAIIASGSEVIIYCNEEPINDLATVPNLNGLSYSDAREILEDIDVFIKSSGAVISPTEEVVYQGTKAGEKIERGSVIEVTISDNSNIGRY